MRLKQVEMERTFQNAESACVKKCKCKMLGRQRGQAERAGRVRPVFEA